MHLVLEVQQRHQEAQQVILLYQLNRLLLLQMVDHKSNQMKVGQQVVILVLHEQTDKNQPFHQH